MPANFEDTPHVHLDCYLAKEASKQKLICVMQKVCGDWKMDYNEITASVLSTLISHGFEIDAKTTAKTNIKLPAGAPIHLVMEFLFGELRSLPLAVGQRGQVFWVSPFTDDLKSRLLVGLN
jgi:hypothetical protein